MAIIDIMEIGRQGLAANRQALTTTSNNIANANTPGYSRQRAVLESNATENSGGVFIGGGVSVPRVIRVHDAFVDRQIIDEARNYGSVRTRSEGLSQMEGLLTRNGYEVGEAVGNFFNAYRELSANPENSSSRTLVLESGEAAAHAFRRVTDSLMDMQNQIDERLSGMVTEINSQAKELAELNEKIAYLETVNQSPNELLDRRDGIVRNLSQKLGAPITTDERGRVSLTASGMGALVNGSFANVMEADRTSASGNKRAGNVDLYVTDGFGRHKATDVLKEGEIAGLIQVRDQYINDTLKQLDHAAFEMARSVNEAHQKGAGMDGESARNFFNPSEEVAGFASRMELSAEVKGNRNAVACGSGKPGDNRIALEISELQSKPVLPANGLIAAEGSEVSLQNTLGESLNNIAGTVAAQTAKENQMLRHQESIMDQLENYRQSISGVSLEEEAVNMMQYQAVFNASAKAMKLGDEMLQTILSIKD